MRKHDRTGYLRYRVPDHQDPTVLLAALGKQGYVASSVYERAATTLTIPYVGPAAEAREHVRGILAELHDSTLGGPPLIYGPVRFEDEPGEGPHAVPPEEGRARLLAEQRAASNGVVSGVGATAEPRALPAWTLGMALVHAAWGTALVADADSVCRAVGVPPTSTSRFVVRSLGARHLGWGAAVAARPSRRMLLIGAAADLVEAFLAVRYAVSARRHRAAAIVPVVVATRGRRLPPSRHAGRVRR